MKRTVGIGRRIACRGGPRRRRRRASSSYVAAYDDDVTTSARAIRRPLERRSRRAAGRSGVGLTAIERQQVDLGARPRDRTPRRPVAVPPRRSDAGPTGTRGFGHPARTAGGGPSSTPSVSWRGSRRRSVGRATALSVPVVRGPWSVSATTAKRPSGDRRGSVGMRRRYRSVGTGRPGTGGLRSGGRGLSVAAGPGARPATIDRR